MKAVKKGFYCPLEGWNTKFLVVIKGFFCFNERYFIAIIVSKAIIYYELRNLKVKNLLDEISDKKKNL